LTIETSFRTWTKPRKWRHWGFGQPDACSNQSSDPGSSHPSRTRTRPVRDSFIRDRSTRMPLKSWSLVSYFLHLLLLLGV